VGGKDLSERRLEALACRLGSGSHRPLELAQLACMSAWSDRATMAASFIAAGLSGGPIKDNSNHDGKRAYDAPCGSRWYDRIPPPGRTLVLPGALDAGGCH
jgi:hypothetical protein